ncbi:MAG: SpoIID/LytB domain-containing protein [Myxococcota bacterium]
MKEGARAGGVALVGLLGVAAIGLLGCGTAMARSGAGPEPVVRVLLYEGTEPIDVGPARAARPVALGTGDRIRVDGRELASPWVPEGTGPWRVGRRVVRGRIAIQHRDGLLQVVNRVGLEDYVASIVGGEMAPSWPIEALRAQAVAARTYVLHEAGRRRSEPWDVLATAQSQVYRGIETETSETRAAARSTAGEILVHRGEPILAVFHSTAGGRTATAGEVWGEDRPYLRMVDVEDEDDAPHTYWRTVFAPAALAGVLDAAGLGVGELAGVTVAGRTGSGRVERLALQGSRRTRTLEGPELRALLSGIGLRSTLFEVRRTPEGIAFVGSGYGHGVGMSQWGARAMAQRGASYQRILARFYPGAQLDARGVQRLAASDAWPLVGGGK